jgi:hypothetical protein
VTMSMKSLLCAGALMIGISGAQAAPISFVATGVTGVSGFVQFDSSSFNGTSAQSVANNLITDLNLNLFGQIFTLANVSLPGATLINSGGAAPLIVGGTGNLADNGVEAIAFAPDGSGGTAIDGDASLAVGPTGQSPNELFLAVRWSVSPPTNIPEPATLSLFGLGLAGIGAMRRRKKL